VQRCGPSLMPCVFCRCHPRGFEQPAAQWAEGIYRLHRGSAKIARHA
jgi:hypothetical protein